MKVILREDVKNLGTMGQVVTVADGFARNFLLPKGLAVEASSKNMKSLEHAKRVIQEKARKARDSMKDLADRLSNLTLVIKAKAGEEGKLFGSVTSMDIAEQLKEAGYDIDRRKISLEEPIKRLGMYTVGIHLHPEIDTRINLHVVEE